MPHNLAIDPSTQKYAMMYTGQVPWHGLGTALANPATSLEAIQAAGLDWEVAKRELYIEGPTAKPIFVPNERAIVREDLWQKEKDPILGVVSTNYTPLQNRDAFTFFDDIVGKNAAIYHTAGALGKGKRIWILAKLPDTIRVVGDDICDKYLLLSNSHDGQSSVQIKFTPIRVVCQNTLTMALNQGPTQRIPHTRTLPERLRQADKLLGIIKNRYDEIEQAFCAMSQVKLDNDRQLQYYRLVFPDPRDPQDEQAVERVRQSRLKVTELFRQGYGNCLPGVAGTLWAAYNSVTQWVDHGKGQTWNERQLQSAWFGEGYLLKARAYQVAIDQLKTWAA